MSWPTDYSDCPQKKVTAFGSWDPETNSLLHADTRKATGGMNTLCNAGPTRADILVKTTPQSLHLWGLGRREDETSRLGLQLHPPAPLAKKTFIYPYNFIRTSGLSCIAIIDGNREDADLSGACSFLRSSPQHRRGDTVPTGRNGVNALGSPKKKAYHQHLAKPLTRLQSCWPVREDPLLARVVRRSSRYGVLGKHFYSEVVGSPCKSPQAESPALWHGSPYIHRLGGSRGPSGATPNRTTRDAVPRRSAGDLTSRRKTT
ncbi:hypothetical protein CISG_01917 [Coccidioides immitis RMSCC 3703]|uniref:Uncharacterized protein n=2 Tax=Coccidioides immitis TaxID=5501 RepID=A0A0J8R508_COCIT|nr:hypothetical protein CIRG_07904 [Coccidioides immitis RMSCC 2394]KMU79500.1 hypothetical protein CISG_01917 [Coccidioides immitis RMSCC 3703]